MTLKEILTGFFVKDRNKSIAIAAVSFGYWLWKAGDISLLSVSIAALSTALLFVSIIGGLMLFLWGARRIGLLFGAPLGSWGSTRSLKSFIADRRRSLARRDGGRPSARGRAQFLLGLALGELGIRAPDTDAMRRSVEAFRDALPTLQAAGNDTKWALTQRNLAVSLLYLSRREVGTGSLHEAVRALRAASAVWERLDNEADWGEDQSILCAVLSRLGQMEDSTERLAEAVAAGRASLAAEDNGDTELADAKISINLTEALTRLGERESGTEPLEEAVALSRQSLTAILKDEDDILEDDEQTEWQLQQQGNLGAALCRLGERRHDAATLREAVDLLQSTTPLRTAKNGYDWALTQHELARALHSLSEHAVRPELPAASLQASDSALAVLTRETFPFDWAIATATRAATLHALVQKTPSRATLLRIADDLKAALTVFEQAGGPVQRRQCQDEIERVQALLDTLDGSGTADPTGAPPPEGPMKPRPA